ncbi:MAG: hypothetical protein [Bacteriophage sp.]|nr:MAG: hypothetical protein [Bacteriophage sp.]
MTVKEVFDACYSVRSNVEHNHSDYVWLPLDKGDLLAIDIVLFELLKGVAKRPKSVGSGLVDVNLMIEHDSQCPTCGAINDSEYNFCPHCGQALDWCKGDEQND